MLFATGKGQENRLFYIETQGRGRTTRTYACDESFVWRRVAEREILDTFQSFVG
jgi:hypothetical protein